MSTVTRPRGPLPPRVYWVRRGLVGGVALALVFGLAHLFGGSSGGSGTPSARVAAAPVTSPTGGLTPDAVPTTPSGGEAGGTGMGAPGDGSGRGSKHGKNGKEGKAQQENTPLAVPTGPCQDSDVHVEPTVDEDAYAGQDVVITLNLTTEESPACTWHVSPRSVVLQLTSGSDRIWSSQDCPRAIEGQSVVVRKEAVTKVHVTWSGQRSDDECTRTTDWAQPGYYHAQAAALGAEPEDQQFKLRSPVPATITATPKVEKGPKSGERDEAAADQAAEPVEQD